VFGQSVKDTLDYIRIYDANGVAHDIPSQYYATSSCDVPCAEEEEIELIEDYVDNGSLVFTVPVGDLASLMGIDITFPARIVAKVTCQPHYAVFLDTATADTEAGQDVGCVCPCDWGYHKYSNLSPCFDPDDYYLGVADGLFLLGEGVYDQGMSDTGFGLGGKYVLALVRPAGADQFDVVRWLDAGVEYDPDTYLYGDEIVAYLPLSNGLKIKLSDRAALESEMQPDDRVVVLLHRQQFHHGEYFSFTEPSAPGF
jgi:hypothetical protein